MYDFLYFLRNVTSFHEHACIPHPCQLTDLFSEIHHLSNSVSLSVSYKKTKFLQHCSVLHIYTKLSSPRSFLFAGPSYWLSRFKKRKRNWAESQCIDCHSRIRVILAHLTWEGSSRRPSLYHASTVVLESDRLINSSCIKHSFNHCTGTGEIFPKPVRHKNVGRDYGCKVYGPFFSLLFFNS